MKYCFYITDHGLGHASRNVAIMAALIKMDPGASFLVKSDLYRCEFIKKNLLGYNHLFQFFDDCHDVGVMLKQGTMEMDWGRTRDAIIEDQKKWECYIGRECAFLNRHNPDVVISDIVCWALESARICSVPSILISSFIWSTVYKDFLEDSIYTKYLEYYKKASQAIWYDIHEKGLDNIVMNSNCVSLVSRAVNREIGEKIRNSHARPIVFVSLGESANLLQEYDVSFLPYDFLVTKGIKLCGSNVYYIPDDAINTPDYIYASEVVIAKGGWSTVAEALLQNKKCALLFRKANREDSITRRILEEREQCISINDTGSIDFKKIIENTLSLNSLSYKYKDSSDYISTIIIETVKKYKGD